MPSTAPRRLGFLACLVLLSVVAAGAPAQENFRIVYNRDQREASGANHVILVGRVHNEARRDALNVYLTAEALDASGKVVASGVTYVSPTIQRSASATFTVKVPRVHGIATFRLMISSFRFGLGVQGP